MDKFKYKVALLNFLAANDVDKLSLLRMTCTAERLHLDNLLGLRLLCNMIYKIPNNVEIPEYIVATIDFYKLQLLSCREERLRKYNE